jgi:hypothetical protein
MSLFAKMLNVFGRADVIRPTRNPLRRPVPCRFSKRQITNPIYLAVQIGMTGSGHSRLSQPVLPTI